MGHLTAIAESFDTELKAWIDPADEASAAKIARACIALRNNNGGKLIFGFDDKSLEQITETVPADVRRSYHSDVIHRIISKFALPQFDVEVLFEEKNGILHPIILIRGGVESPVMTKAHSPGELKQNTVYVRCLSNGTVSSDQPKTPQDWDRLMRICFDNREADVGRFFARHLPQIASAMRSIDDGSVAEQVLKKGKEHFETKHKELVELKLAPEHLFGFREVAFYINGPTRRMSMAEFTERIFASQPHYTGWPPWLNRSGATAEFRPYVRAQGLEACGTSFRDKEVDFWRMEPTGRFYHLRTHEDDTARDMSRLGVATILDWVLVIIRASEHIATAKAFGEALTESPQDTMLEFAFRWTGLEDRELYSWTEPGRSIMSPNQAHDEQITSLIKISLDTPSAAIPRIVKEATQPLFDQFRVSLGLPVFEELTTKVLDRRL